MIEIHLNALVVFEVLAILFVSITIWLTWRLKAIRDSHLAVVECIRGNLERGEKRLIFTNLSGLDSELSFAVNELLSAYYMEKSDMEKKEKERKLLFSNLSHDVRTPLASIIGYLEAIRLGIAGDERDEYLRVAEEKSHTLKHYLDSLFVMAKIDAGDMELEYKEVDLNESLRELMIPYLPLLSSRQLEVQVEIPEERSSVRLDVEALSRIFNNLLQNAIKYGASGGVVGLKAWREGNNACFEIWDAGVGIDQADLPFVFERLYRGDKARRSGGSGIGLSVVKELVHAMGGSVNMRSQPDMRTGAVVVLPVQQGQVCKDS